MVIFPLNSTAQTVKALYTIENVVDRTRFPRGWVSFTRNLRLNAVFGGAVLKAAVS